MIKDTFRPTVWFRRENDNPVALEKALTTASPIMDARGRDEGPKDVVTKKEVNVTLTAYMGGGEGGGEGGG